MGTPDPTTNTASNHTTSAEMAGLAKSARLVMAALTSPGLPMIPHTFPLPLAVPGSLPIRYCTCPL